MTQDLQRRILKYFNKQDLYLVITDSFSQEKLASFINKIGLDFPGMRISSIPKDDLSMALTEEAYQHPEIMDELISFLNRANQAEIDRIRMSSAQEIRRYIGNVERFYINNNVGNVLWALVCDDRRDVNNLIKGFRKEVIRFAERSREMYDAGQEEIGEKTGLETILEEEVRSYVRHLEEDAKDNIKVLQRLRGENKRLVDEIEKLQERIHELQKVNGRLINEKGMLKKENERLQRQIDDLKQEVLRLKQKLQTAPKAKLASELHQVERENKKLLYELEKERLAAKGCSIEKGQLLERLNELQIMTYRLEEELGRERQRVADLEKAKQPQVTTIPLRDVIPNKGRRLGIFVDGQNVYYSARLHYGKRVDYKKLISMLTRDRHLVKAVCYIIEQPDVEQEKFINMLMHSGYTVKTRSLIRRADGSMKANWDVGMAADIINAVDRNSLDIVVLVTCDGDFVDLVRLLKPKGIRVEVAGFPYNTAMELKNVADEFYPIEEDLMLVG